MKLGIPMEVMVIPTQLQNGHKSIDFIMGNCKRVISYNPLQVTHYFQSSVFFNTICLLLSKLLLADIKTFCQFETICPGSFCRDDP
jgi:hypothetical protein